MHEIGCLQRMPWSVALLAALMVACAAVGLPLYGCAMEIQALTQQEEFMGNLTQVRAHSQTIFGAIPIPKSRREIPKSRIPKSRIPKSRTHLDGGMGMASIVVNCGRVWGGSCGTISAVRCWTRAT